MTLVVVKKSRPLCKPPIKEKERLASIGLTQERIFTRLGISLSTFYKHKTEYSDFSDTIKRECLRFSWRFSLAGVANSLYEKAMSGDSNRYLLFTIYKLLTPSYISRQ